MPTEEQKQGMPGNEARIAYLRCNYKVIMVCEKHIIQEYLAIRRSFNVFRNGSSSVTVIVIGSMMNTH